MFQIGKSFSQLFFAFVVVVLLLLLPLLLPTVTCGLQLPSTSVNSKLTPSLPFHLDGLEHYYIPHIFSRQASSISAFTCGESTAGSRVRKEIRNLSPLELERWHTVMEIIMNERPDNAALNPAPSFWDLMVAMHVLFSTEGHNGAFFLPWHRLFLMYIENHIRDTLYPDFTLPYWDWSHSNDAADPAMSVVWGTRYLGGSHNPNNSNEGAPIPNGPFQGMRAHYMNDHPIRRGFNSSVTGSIPPFINATVLQRLIELGKDSNWTWGDFSDAVEAEHNRVHIFIGGDMLSSNTACNDPVFYLHHTFIDKIWWQRQQLFPNEEYIGTHTFSSSTSSQNNTVDLTMNVTSDFVFHYFNLPVNVTFQQDCVTYQQYNSSDSSGDEEVVDDSVPSNNSSDFIDICERTEMMSKERCRHGEAIVEVAKCNSSW